MKRFSLFVDLYHEFNTPCRRANEQTFLITVM